MNDPREDEVKVAEKNAPGKLSCPKCGGKTKVTDTRSTSGNAIRRRRLCLLCGHRCTSREEYL
jgi:Predicted transcriptional regulator, consists of a Zn-ribbon and ATP-cone domains